MRRFLNSNRATKQTVSTVNTIRPFQWKKKETIPDNACSRYVTLNSSRKRGDFRAFLGVFFVYHSRGNKTSRVAHDQKDVVSRCHFVGSSWTTEKRDLSAYFRTVVEYACEIRQTDPICPTSDRGGWRA